MISYMAEVDYQNNQSIINKARCISCLPSSFFPSKIELVSRVVKREYRPIH